MLDDFVLGRLQMSLYIIHIKGVGGAISFDRDIGNTAGNEKRNSHRQTKNALGAKL